jgi:hypothetical protein
MNEELFATCLRCELRKSAAPCAGVCLCPQSGRAIAEHAAEELCPAGRYRIGFGDALARLIDRVGLKRLFRRWEFISTSCGGCDGRQLVLNTAVPWRPIWLWLQEAIADVRSLFAAGSTPH